MGLVIKAAELASRAIRIKATGNDEGLRTITALGGEETKDKDGGIIGFLLGGAARFVGFLMGAIWKAIQGIVSWSLSTLWGLIVGAIRFIWNFNWFIGDKDLDKSVETAFNQLGGSLGGLLGSAVGWLACGVLPGAVIFAFNEPLGVYVLKEVGEEAAEELIGNAANVARVASNVAGKAIFAFLFKGAREALLEELVNRKMIPEDKALKIFEGKLEPWSFAKKWEETVESIPNEFLKNFIEELFEEATEACVEAGYVVANSIDGFIAANKLANKGVLGAERTVEITFNRGSDDDEEKPK